MIQLAGHLRGKARQEFLLLDPSEKSTYAQAISTLSSKFNFRSRSVAAQDFRNATQGPSESVSDYILRLEKIFRHAYGQVSMGTETWRMLLYAQLQEELQYALMKVPPVAGASDYSGLCIAAKNEKRRLSKLSKKQQYLRDPLPDSQNYRSLQQSFPQQNRSNREWTPTRPQSRGASMDTITSIRQCYVCGKLDHIARDYGVRKTESLAKTDKRHHDKDVSNGLNAITLVEKCTLTPMDILLPDSDDDDSVSVVCVTDKGSQAKRVLVDVAGVCSKGLVDTGADITIMGPELFKRVTFVAGITKKQVKPADKIPFTYDRHQFQLDGYVDLNVTFEQRTMCTPVYLKMDAHDNLLLSEGLCHQLVIAPYHPKVSADTHTSKECSTKSVRVSLVSTVRIPPRMSATVIATLDNCTVNDGSFLFQPVAPNDCDGLQLDESLIKVSKGGRTTIALSNQSGYTCKLLQGTCVGILAEVDSVDPATMTCPDGQSAVTNGPPEECSITSVRVVKTSDMETCKRKLQESVAEIGATLPWQEKAKLLSLTVCDHHDLFALGER